MIRTFKHEQMDTPEVELLLADYEGLRWAQKQVITHHYLHKPVDVRCSPVAYIIVLGKRKIGCLIFGRPESTKVNGWYGSLQDVVSGKCRMSYWEVLNLARVWLVPDVQPGGQLYSSTYLPGFVDRKGVWRSSLASTVIDMAFQRIFFDFLYMKPPVWMDQPYHIREILSYCDTRIHRGTVYRASRFTLVRTNEYGIETYVRPIARSLTEDEVVLINKRSRTDIRCIRLRSKQRYTQLNLFS